MEAQKIDKEVLSNKNVGVIRISDFKLYCRAILIKNPKQHGTSTKQIRRPV
jgi:hypothetical protein